MDASSTQVGGMAGIIDRVAALGAVFDMDILEATKALYEPHIANADAAVKVTTDIAYGADPRQKLDLYAPAAASERVLVFIPGGGFVGGDKDDGTFYGNLGRYFAGHGITTVVANYRLAPKDKWPARAEDVAGAVAWTRQNAGGKGGAPRRVFLYGQSAGAAHAAAYLFDGRFHPAGGVGIDAAVLMSGVFSPGTKPTPPASLYYGEDTASYVDRAPISHVATSKVPLLLTCAEYDPAFLSAPTYDLADKVTWRDGKSPAFHLFAGHNHVSTVMSFGTAQDDVGTVVRAFMDRFG